MGSKSVQISRISRCWVVGRAHAKNAFFGVCGFLWLDGTLSTASGDISANLGASGRIFFTENDVYKFLKVFGKKKKKPCESSRHHNGYEEGKKKSYK